MRWIVPLLLAIAPAQVVNADTADRLSYVILDGTGSGSTMSGSSYDFDRARALSGGQSGLLYVRQDGVAYVIRDPALLRRAEAIVQPQKVLGARQGALGRQQGALGRQQGGLGQEQARLGRMMAYSTPQQMAALGRQQGDLGRRQSALGEQQAALGRQQGELGREQARLAEQAQPQFRALLAEAIQRGLAQRLD